MDEKTYNLYIPEPAMSSIILTNTSEEVNQFKLKLNERIFYSEIELVDYITWNYKENLVEPLYWKVWDFVVKNTCHHIPLSEDKWYHSPLLFINSFGFGLCDDINTFLSNVWKMSGYRSRVLHLNGHIVPEVFPVSKWKMFDADCGTYCLTSDKQIANIYDINEFCSSVDLKVNDNSIYGNLMLLFNMSKNIIQLYLSASSHVESWYDTCLEFTPGSFSIPPNGYLEFPGVFKKNITIPKVGKLGNIALAKLFIPQGFSGTISQPLQIAGISGKGTIQLNNKIVNISNENEGLINFDVINNTCKILTAKSDLIIYYFVNPYIFKIEKNSTIKISGNNCDCLDFQLGRLQSCDSYHYNFDLINNVKSIIQDDGVKNINSNNLSDVKFSLNLLSKCLDSYELSPRHKRSINNKFKLFLSNAPKHQMLMIAELMQNKYVVDILINRLY